MKLLILHQTIKYLLLPGIYTKEKHDVTFMNDFDKRKHDIIEMND